MRDLFEEARALGQQDVLNIARRYLRATEYYHLKSLVTKAEEPSLVLEVPVSTARQANGGSSASAARSTAAIWPSTGEPEH